jgi:hypothetical protein
MMEHMSRLAGLRWSGATALVALFMLASPLRAADATLAALSPQPAADAIEPGLAVKFYYSMFNDVSEVDARAADHKGTVGKPIAKLDMRTMGEVFDSGVKEGVGLEITGLLRFPSAGEWKLIVLSNDGVRVSLSDKVVLNDPGVHSDRYSDPATLVVPAAGWYKLAIVYFQKKFSSALQLSWKVPGSNDFVLIPAEAYAHLKSAE